MSRKIRGILITILVLTLAVVAVGEGPAAAAKSKPPFTIALSNGFIGSEWRHQMVERAEAVFNYYKEKGLVTGKLIVQHAGLDTTKQIAQIRNMINSRVDAIIINPNSQTALNPVIEEAVDAGIVVICIDQAVTSPKAINVVIDQSRWAAISAEWLANKLGGKGNIVAINGLAGHPANEDRWRGAKSVFDKHPGIKILTDTNANWDQATGQQVMSNLLATYPSIDGVWVQDGMAEGAIKAILASGRKFPIVTGEARVGFLKLWKELHDKNPSFTSIGVVNPPGIAASGLHVAMQILQGRKFKDGALKNGNTLFVPIPGVVTQENFDQYWKEYKDKPDTYTLDGWISEEQARSYFK
ncbi:MAG TPA: ABC transporter substrate-binding protein [Firmicutes bacterium]|nr:ABC transporter substrate-binding protein [Bacillota bacterium]